MLNKIAEIIAQGEGISTEFKESRSKLNRDIYETITAFPAKFVIEKKRVYSENANRPHGHGLIDPSNFSPFPKNPLIARFFREIGLAEELGSGVRNLYKYTKLYADGANPQLFEDDIFKIIIPLSGTATEQATEQAAESSIDNNLLTGILKFCQEPKTGKEIQEFLGLKHREHFRSVILGPLLKRNLLRRTIPDKPTSPRQKYYSVSNY